MENGGNQSLPVNINTRETYNQPAQEIHWRLPSQIQTMPDKTIILPRIVIYPCRNLDQICVEHTSQKEQRDKTFEQNNNKIKTTHV